MMIGILAVQGAFAEHEAVLEKLNIPYKEIRQEKDLQRTFDGLIFPGGESTVQGKLLRELHLSAPLHDMIQAGTPVLATCAGMILLAAQIEGQSSSYFATIPMTVRRNAYGRQLGSFHTQAAFGDIGTIPMTFIRAPYVTSVGEGVSVLSTVENHIVAVQYQRQIALAFHPELDPDLRVHQAFLRLCGKEPFN